MNVIILIPAYNPTELLIVLVHDLVRHGARNIVVVNDGSKPECDQIFAQLGAIRQCRIIHHAVNLGKGAAIKSGFNHVLVNMPNIDSIVTADADGQHAPEDIMKVAEASSKNPGVLILGVRTFGREVPKRSLIGNQITRLVTYVFTGLKLSDTQTGLRAWPRQLCMNSLKIAINGYDFEMESLLRYKKYHGSSLRLLEIPIRTIYEKGNASSHFDPLIDSMRIYYVFIRYILASLLTVATDYLVFFAAYRYSHRVGLSMIAGRSLAIIVSYYLNRKVVFHAQKNRMYVFLKFVMVVVALGLISYASINFLHAKFDLNIVVSKALVEAILFLAGFSAVNLFVFNDKPDTPNEATDWDAYYDRPYKTASFTRKVTERYLRDLLDIYRPKEGGLKIAELGGANSCFFDMISDRYAPQQYHIYDNNSNGLNRFADRKGPVSGVETHLFDILDTNNLPKLEYYDIVFSVGLIEHFDASNTAKAIEAHFKMLKPSGIAIITFPTDTFLYRTTRALSVFFKQWIFHDERPLTIDEVTASAEKFGTILYKKLNWRICLTQYILAVRKNGPLRSLDGARIAAPRTP